MGVLRSSPLATAIVALTVSLTYLAATFVDCERPSLLPSRSVAVENDAPHSAGAGHDSAAPHDAAVPHHAAAPDLAAAPGHSPAPHHGSAISGSHEAGHEMAAGHGAGKGVWAGLPADLEWAPTCLCGCSETRSLAASAGGVLGAVALVGEQTPKLPMGPLRPVAFYALPDRLLELPLDPIPI